MKILILCDFYNENMEYRENILPKYYKKFNHDVTIIASTYKNAFNYIDNKNNDRPAEIYYHNKVKVIRLKFRLNILNRFKYFTTIKDILIEEKPDLIYVHGIIPNMIEVIPYLKKNKHARMVMGCHGDYSNSAKNWLSLKILHGVMRKLVLNYSMKYISKIFAVVPESERFLNEVYNVSSSKIEILPIGADLDLLDNVLKDREKIKKLKKKYNIKETSRVIITGGKLTPLKKTELLIQAFIKLNNMLSGLCLIIIGKSSENDMEYYNSLLNLSQGIDNIYFVGWLRPEDIYAHFYISDIAVFPASQSVLWQQAIATGLPLIVGLANGQTISYLNKYNNISTLEENEITSENITKEIYEIFTNKKKYSLMVSGAQKITKEKLDWNNLIHETLKFNNIDNE